MGRNKQERPRRERACEAEIGLGGASVSKRGKKGPAGRECARLRWAWAGPV